MIPVCNFFQQQSVYQCCGAKTPTSSVKCDKCLWNLTESGRRVLLCCAVLAVIGGSVDKHVRRRIIPVYLKKLKQQQQVNRTRQRDRDTRPEGPTNRELQTGRRDLYGGSECRATTLPVSYPCVDGWNRKSPAASGLLASSRRRKALCYDIFRASPSSCSVVSSQILLVFFCFFQAGARGRRAW